MLEPINLINNRINTIQEYLDDKGGVKAFLQDFLSFLSYWAVEFVFFTLPLLICFPLALIKLGVELSQKRWSDFQPSPLEGIFKEEETKEKALPLR